MHRRRRGRRQQLQPLAARRLRFAVPPQPVQRMDEPPAAARRRAAADDRITGTGAVSGGGREQLQQPAGVRDDGLVVAQLEGALGAADQAADDVVSRSRLGIGRRAATGGWRCERLIGGRRIGGGRCGGGGGGCRGDRCAG